MIKSTHSDPTRSRLCLIFLLSVPISFRHWAPRQSLLSDAANHPDIVSGPHPTDVVPYMEVTDHLTWLKHQPLLSEDTQDRLDTLLLEAEEEDLEVIIITNKFVVDAVLQSFMCPVMEVNMQKDRICVGMSHVGNFLSREDREEMGRLLGFIK